MKRSRYDYDEEKVIERGCAQLEKAHTRLSHLSLGTQSQLAQFNRDSSISVCPIDLLL